MTGVTVRLMRCGKIPRWRPLLVGRGTRGIVTIEAVIGVVFVVAAVIFMLPYMQRAMQGGLFSSIQSLGLPFDRRDGYVEVQRLQDPGGGPGLSETVKQQVNAAMLGAEILPVEPLSTWAVSGRIHQNWVFSSVPAGPVPREPASQDTEVGGHWTATRTATYDDNR